MYRADTIVACATPPGHGAIAVVRLSGAAAGAIAATIFRPSRPPAGKPWRLYHGLAVDPADASAIDEVLEVTMPGPASYTGEDIVEFHCHGSPLVVERLVSTAIRLGARGAERGEFTRRAVLNGRMDLLQAEAVADLIDATMDSGVRMAWAQMQGTLSDRLSRVRSLLLNLLAEVEADVDFSDEELPEEGPRGRLGRLRAGKAEVARLLEGFAAGRRRREGLSVVFSGRPNVGKSSLVNALLGSERMIVSEEAGTTRDSVEETIDLGAVGFVLTDTAGIRDAVTAVEIAAVARARDKLQEADIEVLVLDRSEPLRAEDRALLDRESRSARLIVMNKVDLPAAFTAADRVEIEAAGPLCLRVSALTGMGCGRLADSLKDLARRDLGESREPALISRLRHRTALERCRAALDTAVGLQAGLAGSELVALELRSAVNALAEITDAVDNEEVLDRIFSQFCIGK